MRASLLVWRRWHRRAGLAACLFLILLAVSGIALNRSAELELDQRFVTVPWMLNLFGVEAPPIGTSFKAGANYYTQVGDWIYRDTEHLINERMIGALEVGAYQLVATAVPALLLVDHNGRTVERLLDADGVPAHLSGIGRTNDGRIALQAGGDVHVLDPVRLEVTNGTVSFVPLAPADAPDELIQRIVEQYRGRGLSIERALLELHSGRIGGELGRWIVDAAGVVSIALALSGLVIWWRRRP